MNTPSDRSFLGKGWGFPPGFTREKKDVNMVSREDDILQSLKILLLTSPGERVMHPDFGCALRSLVFDVIDENTLTALRDIIERAVLFFETRIILDRVEVDTKNQYEGFLNITLTYTVKATNSRHNMVFPFYFLEGQDG